MMARLVSVVVVLAIMCAGCTTPEPAAPTTTATVSSREDAVSQLGSWSESRFETASSIRDFIVTADGTFAALATQTRGGSFRVYELDEELEWQPSGDWARPSMDGLESVAWHTLVEVEGGYAVGGVGSLSEDRGEMGRIPVFARVSASGGEPEFRIDVERSEGGSVHAAVSFDGHVIGVGSASTEDQSWGPRIWSTVDGLNWTAVAAPGELRRALVDLVDVAASSEVVIAVGSNVDDSRAPWVAWSTDGTNWDAARLPDVDDAESVRQLRVTYDGDEFAIFGNVSGPDGLGTSIIWRSVDGLNFLRDRLPIAQFGDGRVRNLDASGRNGHTLLAGHATHRSNVLYCYDDVDDCRNRFQSLWLRTESEWNRIDTPVEGEFVSRAATDGNRIVAAGSIDRTPIVWVWSPDAEGSELYGQSLDAAPPESQLALVPNNRQVEPSTTYAYPLATRCRGMRVLGQLNDTWWLHASGARTPIDAWPTRNTSGDFFETGGVIVYGTIELTADDRIDYSIPGIGVVATYEPAPSDYTHFICH